MATLYRLYVDESGDHSYGKGKPHVFRLKTPSKIHTINYTKYPEMEDDNKRYLGVIGCMVEADEYRSSLDPNLTALKQKHFPHSPDDPVILHREDIINKRGPFWRLRNPTIEKAFNEDLIGFLVKSDFTIINVLIDKKSHIGKYGDCAYNPYSYCLAALLERYCGRLKFLAAKGDVLAEGRGKREDYQLKEAYQKIYSEGTDFRRSDFFNSVLTSKEIKIKPKSKNISGLQLADLLVYPIKKEMRLSQTSLEVVRMAVSHVVTPPVSFCQHE